MKMKELFNELDIYNKISDLLGTGYHAKICFVFGETDCPSFDNFKDFRSYFRQEIIDEIADFVLTSNDFEFNVTTEYTWVDKFGDTRQESFTPELTY